MVSVVLICWTPFVNLWMVPLLLKIKKKKVLLKYVALFYDYCFCLLFFSEGLKVQCENLKLQGPVEKCAQWEKMTLNEMNGLKLLELRRFWLNLKRFGLI